MQARRACGHEADVASGATAYDEHNYENLKNYDDTQACLPKNGIIVNRSAFNALDKPTQAAVLKAAADAETRGWKLSEEKAGWYVDQLRQKGMTIDKPSEQLTADMRKVGNVMWRVVGERVVDRRPMRRMLRQRGVIVEQDAGIATCCLELLLRPFGKRPQNFIAINSRPAYAETLTR